MPESPGSAGEPPTDVPGSPARSSGRGVTVIGWVGVGALVLITLLGRYLASPPGVVLLALVGLPWLWLAWSGVVLIMAVASGRRRALWPAMVCVAVLALVWGRVWAAMPRGAEVGAPLTVMSWNVQRLGFEDSDRGSHLNCVVAEVKRTDPDALVLLEVSGDDLGRLSDRLGLECVYTDYRGTGSQRRGGLAACARGESWSLGERAARRYVDDIDWYYTFAELVRGDDVFNLFAVHLQPYRMRIADGAGDVAAAQTAETAALLAKVDRLKDPTIVAGDFNSPRDARVHVHMRETMTDVWERAGWGPGGTVLAMGIWPIRVDYLYASDGFGVRDASHPEPGCSDHRPVVSQLLMGR